MLKVKEIKNPVIFKVYLSHWYLGTHYTDFIIDDDKWISFDDEEVVKSICEYYSNYSWENIKIQYNVVIDNTIYHKVLYDGSILDGLNILEETEEI